MLRIHGLVKGSALMLGLACHDGDDLVITEGWEALLDGLGYSLKGNEPMKIEDAEKRLFRQNPGFTICCNHVRRGKS